MQLCLHIRIQCAVASVWVLSLLDHHAMVRIYVQHAVYYEDLGFVIRHSSPKLVWIFNYYLNNVMLFVACLFNKV